MESTIYKVVCWTGDEAARLMKTVCQFKLEFPNAVTTDWLWIKKTAELDNFTTDEIEMRYTSFYKNLKLEDESTRQKKLQALAADFAAKYEGKRMSEMEEIVKICTASSRVKPSTLLNEVFMNYMGYFKDSTTGRNSKHYIKRLKSSLKYLPTQILGELVKLLPFNDNDNTGWELEYWQAVEDIEKLKRIDAEREKKLDKRVAECDGKMLGQKNKRKMLSVAKAIDDLGDDIELEKKARQGEGGLGEETLFQFAVKQRSVDNPLAAK